MRWLIGWRWGGSLDGAVVAHWMVLWWLIGWRFGGSLDGTVVAHWIKMWWLIGWSCGGSTWLELCWLIGWRLDSGGFTGWRCGGSLDEFWAVMWQGSFFCFKTSFISDYRNCCHAGCPSSDDNQVFIRPPSSSTWGACVYAIDSDWINKSSQAAAAAITQTHNWSSGKWAAPPPGLQQQG